jgi:Domain of unknown function (DUF1772)
MMIWATVMLVCGGLFAGAITAIAWERLPAWRTMPRGQFTPDFAGAIRRAERIQPALLVATIVAALGFSAGSEGLARIAALAGALGFAGSLIGTAVVMVPLQRRIIAAPEGSRIETMQRRWFRGHVGRSALSAISFVLLAGAVAASM